MEPKIGVAQPTPGDVSKHGDLNLLLRQRVESINWRTLIHKLALLLGYKRIQGVEVFRQESADFNSGAYLLQ